jgi:hypothetical protein
MNKIFIINNSLVELKGGKLVKSAIELPNGLLHLITSYDFKIIAICQDTSSILIYELIGTQFVIKHKINKTPTALDKFCNKQGLYSYVSNYLILKYITYCSHIYEIIDLENTNDDLDSFIMFHGLSPAYCDGILSFCPIGYSKQHYNLKLADKSITHECPYFMKNIMQIKLNAIKNGNYISYVKGYLIINNDIYHILTGNLLGSTTGLKSYNEFNINYFVLSEKINIAPGAPVTEYEYDELYIYDINVSNETLTKMATTCSDN